MAVNVVPTDNTYLFIFNVNYNVTACNQSGFKLVLECW